ncbi:chemotaxis response regulator protein-glutamate methylesterase [Iningainema tapete]|uniref:Protein-glutamate methylesterase/protein-glutamine glutaminase n=1 Tax=Iningainema tapete BLCC-T55 TaxID=2748662 RepID=A0A8J6XN94_9CYAN|nr:chemotaxis response regulator protein-glutamate methylesterase [Iningainema tapete]MBD2774156.1 chemotaxis response regulator protein-glutamate methylesterase [Iningainema tapete BLCC-T55]
MRIAIVNDMPIAQEALRRVLVTIPEYEIAWIAGDGVSAVTKCAADTPDLILMDLFMPIMNGVEATRQIMANSPCPILIVTSAVSDRMSQVFEAMGYGALDAINTPVLNPDGSISGDAVLAKIATIAKLSGKSAHRNPKSKSNSKSLPPLLAIGSSTGGPQALATLLSGLSKNFSAGVVIIQHVDSQFASGLAEWLSNYSPLPIRLAVAGEQIQPGKVLIAATNDHLVLQPTLVLKYTKEPRDFPYRPSVDVFFNSVAQHWHGKGVGVLLTGMGRDGGEGMKALRSVGWHTIAQDQATSVVYGMPKAAADLKAAVEILPINAIAKACQEHLSRLSF